MSVAQNPFGDGNAAGRIVDIVEQRLCGLFNPQQSELAYASISSAAGDCGVVDFHRILSSESQHVGRPSFLVALLCIMIHLARGRSRFFHWPAT